MDIRILRVFNLISILFAMLVFIGCGNKSVSPWNSEDAWFQTGKAINANYTDVLYFVSVNILNSTDADGNKSLTAVLNDEEKKLLSMEMAYMRDSVFADSLNYFAPFYHEVTMDALLASGDSLQLAFESNEQECLGAFNYYMENLNNGRPFILAGFSLGGMMVKSLLKNMTDEQYKQMVAAYVIGDELTALDLKCPRVKPAHNATDRGVTISFNSVTNVDSIWPLICSNPAACINPVNWCTDATPAPLQDGEISLSVAVDTVKKVLVVTGYGDNLPSAPFEPWPKGCLHHQDILLYSKSLGRNALKRAYE